MRSRPTRREAAPREVPAYATMGAVWKGGRFTHNRRRIHDLGPDAGVINEQQYEDLKAKLLA